MRILQVTAVTLCLAAGAALPASAAGVNHRQELQRNRIVQGWNSGELTRGEALGIGRQQQRIARTEARMRADGGGLNRFERVRLHEMQDHASTNIYAKKHNERER